jgi:polyhydroxyalkanoate synthesis regulator protein
MNVEPILIKRYAGKRLYNTQSAGYVTLQDLANMVLGRIRFIVRDAETGADITLDYLKRLN